LRDRDALLNWGVTWQYSNDNDLRYGMASNRGASRAVVVCGANF